MSSASVVEPPASDTCSAVDPEDAWQRSLTLAALNANGNANTNVNATAAAIESADSPAAGASTTSPGPRLSSTFTSQLLSA